MNWWWSWFSAIWSCFGIALLVVTIIFLHETVVDQQEFIPNLNMHMCKFVLVGHWMMVGYAVASIVYSIVIYARSKGENVIIPSISG